jgi:hypothetical protein
LTHWKVAVILSNMESTGASPEQAAAAIADAEAGRTSLVSEIVVPRLFFESIGAAVALQIGTTAAGLTAAGSWFGAVLVAGLVVFLAVSGYELARFRNLNGVWLGGLVSRVVGGTATAASVSYVAAFGGATWAALTDAWWLVPLFAVAGGAGYALSGRRWMRKYRSQPAGHSRGESAAFMTVVGVLAVGGLVLLVTQR